MIALDESAFVQRLERSPRVTAIAARIDIANADVVAASIRANPSLAYDREEVFADAGRSPESIISLSWPLDLSGARGRRQRAARRGVDATRAEVAHERTALVLDGLELFHDAAAARLRVDALTAARTALATLVDTVRVRAKGGDVAGYDLDRLELELGSYDDVLAEAEIDLAAARRRLSRVLGEPTARFDAIDTLEPAAAPSITARRQDLVSARVRADAAALEGSSARRSWLSGLSVTGGFKMAEVGDETAYGYLAGISLELPVHDASGGLRARAAARRREAEAQAAAIEREIAAGLPAAAETLRMRAAEATKFEAAQLPRARELVRRAEVAYREGERPVFELLDAHRVAREIELRRLELRRWTKAAEVELYRERGYR